MEENNELVPIGRLNMFLNDEISKKQKRIYNFLCRINGISELGSWNENDRLKHTEFLNNYPKNKFSNKKLLPNPERLPFKEMIRLKFNNFYFLSNKNSIKNVQAFIKLIQKQYEEQQELNEINSYISQNAVSVFDFFIKEDSNQNTFDDFNSVNFYFNITLEKEKYLSISRKLKTNDIIDNSSRFLNVFGIEDKNKEKDGIILWNGSGKSLVMFFLMLLDKKALLSSDRLLMNYVLPKYFLFRKKKQFHPITKANVQKALNRYSQSYNSNTRPDQLITFLQKIIDSEFELKKI